MLIEKLKEWYFINQYYLKENWFEWNHYHKRDWNKDYAKFLKTYNPCFVLSTGRCGTGYLTKLLRKNENTVVYHSDFLVPNPLLKFYQSRAYAENNVDVLRKVLEACRAEIIYRTSRTNRRYVETNNRITFFAYAAKLLFPNAQFIHLVRNPADVVRSGIRRQWYSDNDMEQIGRIAYDSQNIISKIACFWNDTQEYIEKFKKDARVLTVRSEDLFTSDDCAQRIFDYLGLEKPKRYSKRIVNEQKTGWCPVYSQWSESNKSLLKRSAPLHKLYGYNNL